MITKIKALFNKKPTPKNDFSEFFYSASAGEKKKLLMKVVREANNDQRAIIERYEKEKVA